MKYFAYGSNCNPAVMAKKGVEFSSRARGSLSGYRLLFNKMALRESLPDEIFSPNSTTMRWISRKRTLVSALAATATAKCCF